MVNLEIPFTFENSSNPWLMDKKDSSNVLVFDGQKYTAKYLWTLNSEQRQKALKNVFNYYRTNGFPKLVFNKEKLEKDFKKLCNFNENQVLTKEGFVSNSGNLCIDLCKYFCQKYFYEAKGGPKTKSVFEIFNDDELLIRVLKNRMGWNSSKEGGGVERPYLFPISDRQLLNGIRNSGMGYAVSNFRPSISKWMYKKAAELSNIKEKAKVFDYSGGWAARAMGALSLGFDYDATDPLTSEYIQNCIDTFKKDDQICNIFDKCSEDEYFRCTSFKEKYDIIGSCPPYFDLEIYSNDEKQSTSTCKEYQDWINIYWKGTVKNCKYMLKNNGIFVLVIKEIVNHYNICEDMCKVITDNNLKLVEKYYYKTTTNHLSGKTKTGRSSKSNEVVLFFKKNNN